jgi:hypothetical protein
MTSPRIRRALAALALALAALATGCGGESTPPRVEVVFTQPEADDVAQMVAATVALDHGGWMVEIANALTARRLEQDTTEIVPGVITHRISYEFTKRFGGLSATWDTSVVSVQAHDEAVGTFAGASGIVGPYHHISNFSVFSADEDTMYFNTLAADTARFAMKSFNRADSVFYHMDNFFDYDELRLLGDAIDPWPIDGAASWLVDANKFPTAVSTASTRNLLVEVLINFNGTQTPPMVVFEDIDEPSTTFRYTIDLKTGVVARTP